MLTSIQLYENRDVYINKNFGEPLGYESTKTFGEMVDLAMSNNCHIIVKNGNGKWYLKGGDKTFQKCKETLESTATNFPRIKSWLLEY
jgi:hypothetical protein